MTATTSPRYHFITGVPRAGSTLRMRVVKPS